MISLRQALGSVFSKTCGTTKAWFPVDKSDAHEGLTLFYNHSATLYELVIYYQLAGRERNQTHDGLHDEL